MISGGNVFGWTIDEKTSFDLLNKFFDKGFNCIDTADVYSAWVPGNKGGESETIIGNWLKKRGRREEVIVITKVGYNVKSGLSKKHIPEALMLLCKDCKLIILIFIFLTRMMALRHLRKRCKHTMTL